MAERISVPRPSLLPTHCEMHHAHHRPSDTALQHEFMAVTGIIAGRGHAGITDLWRGGRNRPAIGHSTRQPRANDRQVEENDNAGNAPCSPHLPCTNPSQQGRHDPSRYAKPGHANIHHAGERYPRGGQHQADTQCQKPHHRPHQGDYQEHANSTELRLPTNGYTVDAFSHDSSQCNPAANDQTRPLAEASRVQRGFGGTSSPSR